MEQSVLNNWPVGRWVLECVDIGQETSDVSSFHFWLKSESGEPTPLCLHRPGQFVTLRLRAGDRLVPRSYTISSSPSRPMLMTLTIKRDANGLVSRFMHDEFKVGDLLPVSGPSGNFDLVSVKPRDRLVMLSGGSGITPLMSMLRYIHDTRSRNFDIVFLHSARTPDDIIFRRELELIASTNNVKLGFICERDAEQEVDGGYLTADILQRYVGNIHDCTVLTCGPAPYMDAVRAMLGRLSFDLEHYHEESFGDPSERDNPEGAGPKDLTVDEIAVTFPTQTQKTQSLQSIELQSGANAITFNTSGKTVSYTPGQTILEVATREGIAVATNCQMGLCGTCKAIKREGVVDMDEEEGLTDTDRSEGYVLTCVGRPKGSLSIDI